jgi:hypothetical protein
MRGFLIFLLFLVFFLAAPLAALSYSLNLALKPEYIKDRLVKSRIYEATAKTLPKLIESSNDKESPVSPEDLTTLEDFAKNEVTASYIQGKSEEMIDDTYNWVSGKTEKAPSISFIDLKEKFKAETKTSVLPTELDQFLSKPLAIEINKNDQGFKRAFQIIRLAPLVLTLLSAISLAAIFLLAFGWKSKMRDTSLALFMPTPIGLIVGGAILCIGNLLSGIVKSSLEKSPFEQLIEPLRNLISTVSNDMAKPIFIVFGIFLLAAVTFFIISFFIGNNPKIVEDTPQNTPSQ